jgi:hypothetical protein
LTRPSLAVVIDFGAASPMGILASARDLADITFICDRRRPYVRGVYEELATLAPVWDVTGLSDAEIAEDPRCGRFEGITTFSESQLVRTAALAHRWGLPFLSPATAGAVTDKYVQRQTLAAAGVQHTACHLVRSAADLPAALAQVGLPAVLKPRSGAASSRTCRVDSPAQAAARLRDFDAARQPSATREYVVEQILVGDPTVAGPAWGDYVSVESVTSHGRRRHIEITGKFPLADPLRETGYVVPSTLGEETRREVLARTDAALTALGVGHGATHTELKLTPAGPQVIEVNGRVGGYVADLIRRARGYDLIRAALGAALGQPGDSPPEGYRRCAFQYFITPPVHATALRRLDGGSELVRHRGIHLVEAVKTPGEQIDWREGTLAYVAIVHGSGASHDDVANLVDLINRTLRVEYEPNTCSSDS